MVGDVSPVALAVVVGMSIVTYATKATGLWVADRVDLPEAARGALDALPGSIVVAILTVRLSHGGPHEWIAGLVVVVVAHRTDNALLAMVTGRRIGGYPCQRGLSGFCTATMRRETCSGVPCLKHFSDCPLHLPGHMQADMYPRGATDE